MYVSVGCERGGEEGCSEFDLKDELVGGVWREHGGLHFALVIVSPFCILHMEEWPSFSGSRGGPCSSFSP